MEETESQIAKICLGNTKGSSTYAYVMAEKAPVGPGELYVVAELPLFNPAAEEDCERICLAISSTFKRAYRSPGAENNFESTISLINEELGKLASLGQTQWIDKLNCILGVKEGNNFSIATTGKVAAYLLRNGEFTDISCSPDQPHPLKTFETYASGKIRLSDLLVLSTTQLFNYLSMDRLLQIVSGNNFLPATQTIIELLKENADPQASFAVLLNLQVAFGQTPEEEVDLQNYIVERPAQAAGFVSKIFSYIKSFIPMDKIVRTPKTDLPKVALGDRLKNFSSGTKNLISRGKGWWQTAKTSARAVKTTVNPQNFSQFSKQKKFLLVSVLILFLAVVANVSIALHLKKTQTTQSQIDSELKSAQSLLANAQASLLYKDDSGAANYLQQAKSKLPKASEVSAGEKALYNQTLTQLQTTETQMEKPITPAVSNLGALGSGNLLFSFPGFMATQVKGGVISYNEQTGSVQDGAFSLPITAVAEVYTGGNNAVIYDGNSLYLWDFSAGKLLGTGFSESVPGKNDFAGMAFYPTNSRVYLANKTSGSVISFSVTPAGFAKPVVSIRDQSLNQAQGLAIDGSVYALTQNGLNKFQSGQLTTFNINSLVVPFAGSGKIYTQKTFANIYLLDQNQNRIMVLDKTGNLLETLKSSQFTKLTDFQVDEKNKVIYVLNDGSLLKVALP